MERHWDKAGRCLLRSSEPGPFFIYDPCLGFLDHIQCISRSLPWITMKMQRGKDSWSGVFTTSISMIIILGCMQYAVIEGDRTMHSIMGRNESVDIVNMSSVYVASVVFPHALLKLKSNVYLVQDKLFCRLSKLKYRPGSERTNVSFGLFPLCWLVTRERERER